MPGAVQRLAGRVETLPAPSRRVLEAMACLGGRVELSLLQTATAAPAGAVEQALAPALEEALLVAEPAVWEAVRFRHDRIRELPGYMTHMTGRGAAWAAEAAAGTLREKRVLMLGSINPYGALPAALRFADLLQEGLGHAWNG